MKKRTRPMMMTAAALLMAVLAFGGCPELGDGPEPDGGADIAVSFTGLTANGSTTVTTTALTLTFDKDIAGLTAEDIYLDAGTTGAEKGGLTPQGGGVYELAVSGVTRSGTVTVTLAKSGYAGDPALRTVAVYAVAVAGDTAVSFTGLTANGSATETTTALTLTFNKDITGLAAEDITINAGSTGTAGGTLTKQAGMGIYELTVSNVTASGTITVAVAKEGYAVSPASKTATVYWVPIPVTFDNLAANGSATETTTALTLTFDKDITGLTETDITINAGSTGTAGGILTKQAGTGIYKLTVSNVANGGEITVGVTKAGYTISPASKTVEVYARPAVYDNRADFETYLSALLENAFNTPYPVALTGALALDDIYDALAAAGRYVALDLTGLTGVTSSANAADTWPKYSAGHDAGRRLIVNLKLPAHVTAIEDADYSSYGSSTNTAFNAFSNLRAVSAGTTFTGAIGSGAFYGRGSLMTADFPAATSIGRSAFETCLSLKEVNFPLATSIGSEAFKNCTSLITATFRAVTYIGAAAFANCRSLTTLTLGTTPPEVQSSTAYGSIFAGCADTSYKTITIRVPKVTTYTGAGFAPWNTFRSGTSSNIGVISYLWDSWATDTYSPTFKVKLAAL